MTAGAWSMPPCTTCGQASVSATRWPDGTYIACCATHVGGGQTGIYTGEGQR